MNYKNILNEIYQEITPLIGTGFVADYIPKLKSISKQYFGMAVQTLNGEIYEIGDTRKNFSFQSISKVFSLALAIQLIGENNLFKRLGREPSGSAFNSLVSLEKDSGIPRNPFINAGAIIVDDIILSFKNNPIDYLLDFVHNISGDVCINYDFELAESENLHGFRNRAIANFIKSYDNLDNDVESVLNFYFTQCSMTGNCIELAKSFSLFANQGVCIHTEEQILTRSQAKRICSLMMTCGTYDSVGDFTYLVGLPAKSGVSGAIIAIIPNLLTVSVWSPGLDKSGNSLAGTKALELFTTKTGISVF